MTSRSMAPAWAPAVEMLAPLAGWFEASRRKLPWRAPDLDAPHPDPYAVLVSELMLQQTQVATVVPYFERWMRAFPDVESLAAAGEQAVHKHWEGLGYYRRARHLQCAARAIAERGWPVGLDGLKELPGLGPYSAAALAAIAFQLPEPALDGNALRVAARLLALADPGANHAGLRDWLRPALAALGPSRTTQAVMELGALVCLPRQPRCGECPLSAACAARSQGLIEACPGTRKRAAPRVVGILLVALGCGDDWLLERPARTGLLAGLWRWPALTLPAVRWRAAEAPAPYGIESAVALDGWVQAYTHRREQVQPFLIRAAVPFDPGPDRAWVAGRNLPGLPMGKRDQRLRDLVLSPPDRSAFPVPLAHILAALRAERSS